LWRCGWGLVRVQGDLASTNPERKALTRKVDLRSRRSNCLRAETSWDLAVERVSYAISRPGRNRPSDRTNGRQRSQVAAVAAHNLRLTSNGVIPKPQRECAAVLRSLIRTCWLLARPYRTNGGPFPCRQAASGPWPGKTSGGRCRPCSTLPTAWTSRARQYRCSSLRPDNWPSPAPSRRGRIARPVRHLSWLLPGLPRRYATRAQRTSRAPSQGGSRRERILD